MVNLHIKNKSPVIVTSIFMRFLAFSAKSFAALEAWYICEVGAQLRCYGSISASLRGQVDAVITEPHWQFFSTDCAFVKKKHCSNKP